MKHPYEEYEASRLWEFVKSSIEELVENNDIDLVIFLRDPYTAKPHEPDVNIIVLLCDKYNIPLATNLASAELLIKALDRGDLGWRETVK